MQQITDARIEAKRPPLLRLAFRPFFLLGTAFAVFAIIRWIWVLQGWISWQGYLPAILWHAHEMLFGFVLAIVIGFLLTAVQTWTGIPGLRGSPLGFLVASWFLARAVFWISPEISWFAYWLPDILLITSAAYFLASPIAARRQWKNLPFVPILLTFALLHSAFIYGLMTDSLQLARASLMSVFWLVLLLISVMGARVIPFFTARRWQIEQYREPQWLGMGLPLGFLVILITQFLSPISIAAELRIGAELCLACGLSWRLYRGHHKNN